MGGLALVAILVAYLNLSPSLKPSSLPIKIDKAKITKNERELAKIDLKDKVYVEIQSRLAETNEWRYRKFLLAGGLLSVFLVQMLLPLVKGTSTSDKWEERKDAAKEVLRDLLTLPATCAALGLACVVAIFIDVHCRRSELVIQQLGSWAAFYGAPVVGGGNIEKPFFASEFMSWEQFIRSGGGMHESWVDAFQIGNLNLITIVLFTAYSWSFHEICRQTLDLVNKLTAFAVLGALLLFVFGAHTTSGNFEFEDYGWGSWGFLITNFWSYFFGWSAVLLIFVVWWRFPMAVNCPAAGEVIPAAS